MFLDTFCPLLQAQRVQAERSVKSLSASLEEKANKLAMEMEKLQVSHCLELGDLFVF